MAEGEPINQRAACLAWPLLLWLRVVNQPTTSPMLAEERGDLFQRGQQCDCIAPEAVVAMLRK